MSLIEISQLIELAELQNCIIGVKLPIDEDEPWKIKPSRKIKEVVFNESLPKSVTITLSNQLFIDITNIPTPLQSRIIRLAAFQNPDFYKAQAMRMSTLVSLELFLVQSITHSILPCLEVVRMN